MIKLPELLERSATKQLDEFCIIAANDKYQPRHLRYRIEGRQVYLYEIRRYKSDPKQHRELPMAQIRFSPDLNQWSLHYHDDERWKIYLNVQPTLDFGRLLTAIKQDPMGHFWQE